MFWPVTKRSSGNSGIWSFLIGKLLKVIFAKIYWLFKPWSSSHTIRKNQTQVGHVLVNIIREAFLKQDPVCLVMVRPCLFRFTCCCLGSTSSFKKSSECLEQDKNMVLASFHDSSAEIHLWQVLMWSTAFPGSKTSFCVFVWTERIKFAKI